VPLSHKFAKQSRDPLHWTQNSCFAAFRTISLQHKSQCKTARTRAIIAQVRKTKSHRNFSQRTHPIHSIGPKTHVGSDGKINSHKFCYLCLTSVIQPLNAIWMRVWLGGKRKLLHHVAAGQVVAATSIDDHSTRTLFDDTLCLEQCVLLILLRFLHLCAQHTLPN
jgi:hypothetical protein